VLTGRPVWAGGCASPGAPAGGANADGDVRCGPGSRAGLAAAGAAAAAAGRAARRRRRRRTPGLRSVAGPPGAVLRRAARPVRAARAPPRRRPLPAAAVRAAGLGHQRRRCPQGCPAPIGEKCVGGHLLLCAQSWRRARAVTAGWSRAPAGRPRAGTRRHGRWRRPRRARSSSSGCAAWGAGQRRRWPHWRRRCRCAPGPGFYPTLAARGVGACPAWRARCRRQRAKHRAEPRRAAASWHRRHVFELSAAQGCTERWAAPRAPAAPDARRRAQALCAGPAAPGGHERGAPPGLQRAWLLVELAGALERRLAAACQGCAGAPPPSAAAAAFFAAPKNRRVRTAAPRSRPPRRLALRQDPTSRPAGQAIIVLVQAGRRMARAWAVSAGRSRTRRRPARSGRRARGRC